MRYILKKAMTMIITLFIVSLLAFFTFQIIPGDVVTSIAGTEASAERRQELRTELGLNKTVVSRYIGWISSFVKGDFGKSYKHDVSVSEMLADKIPVTLTLGLYSLILILIFSIPVGVLSSRFKTRGRSRVFDMVNQILMAIPSFILGILIILVFGLVFRLFQAGDYVSFGENPAGFFLYLTAPAFAIAIPKIAMLVKFLKTEIQNQMGQDYVRTARGKGVGETAILFGHVLKNALIPVITLLGMMIAEILTGSLVVEQVFNIPGLGRSLVVSISERDYPVVQTAVMYIALIVIVVNMLVDILYKIIDPRV